MVAKKQDVNAAKTPESETEPRWDDVRIFLAIARERSLGQAGRRLQLDTSTVSRRLAALEATFGATLFERTRQGLIPTRLAEQMLPAAEEIEASHARLRRSASALEALPEGKVRVSIPPGMADAFLAPAIGRLRARHPRISLEIETSIRVVDLSRHEADIALRGVPPRGAALVVTKLLHARTVIAGAPSLVRELGKLKAWHDAPWIAWDYDLASMPAAAWLARHVKGADIALRTSHMGAQLRAAEVGVGLLLVPEPYLKTHALAPVRYAGSLAPSVARLPEDDLWLVGHRVARDVPRVAAVWSFLADEFRSLA